MLQDASLVVAGTVVGNTVTGQTFTGTDTSVLSTNTIDLSVKRDMGVGADLHMRVFVTTAQTGGTSVEYQVIAADAANLTGNVTVIGSTGPIPVASLTAGARFIADINPRLGSLGQRYLGARAVTVGAVAAGAALIDFGTDIEDGGKFYPGGFAVL